MKTPPNPPTHPALDVLVADDSVVNRRLASGLLKREGHTVTAVTNGYDAVSELRSRQFSVVLMDVEMPVMDGLSATRAIRAAEKNGGIHTPIIALTSITDRVACFKAGVDAFLSKPLEIGALREILDALLVRAAA